MGYQLRSVLSVQSGDTHRFFVYFIPGTTYQFGWISEWINARMQHIADDLGGYQDGVIIYPFSGREREYIESIGQAVGSNSDQEMRENFFHQLGNLLPANQNSNLQQDMRHFYSGEPLLIISRTPLQNITDGDSVIVDLAVCRDEADLGFIIDLIIQVIRKNDLRELNQLNRLEQVRIKDSFEEKERMNPLELGLEAPVPFVKVGISLNKLLNLLATQFYRPYRVQRR